MVRNLFIFGLLYAQTLMNIGASSRGMIFVVACPWLTEGISCLALFTTAEQFVRVTIHGPDTKHLIEKFNIDRSKPKKVGLAVGDAPVMPESSITPAIDIRATGPIRVVVIVYEDRLPFKTDAFVVIPKSSCHRSYYTTTTLGNPFIAVMSFDDPLTRVVVTFPQYMTSNFRQNCSATGVCATGGTVFFALAKYQVWYFSLIHKTKNLHGARIASDLPVYVVAGNEECTSVNTGTSDMCLSAMKSTVTWGKTYIVPNIFPDMAFFIDFLEYPLLVTFHESGKEPETKTARVGFLEVYGQTSNPLAITADSPFGLYQMFPSRKAAEITSAESDAGTLNMIPVEQWVHGFVFTKLLTSENRIATKYIIITKSNTDDVLLPDTDVKINWHEASVTVNDTVYFVGDVNLDEVNTRITVGGSYGSIILYVMIHPDDSTEHHFLASFPYEFHHGEIYQPNCKVSKKFNPDDGVDNDCDGYIDEELKNGIDDDGDGLVDEDYVAKFDDSDGQWGEWNKLCNITCQDKPLSVRVRACPTTSALSKYCEGDSLQCNKGKCPEDCGSNTECYCDAGCQTCEENIFSCDSCKAGYMPTRHCTTPCPPGRSGIGCMDVPVTKVKPKDDRWLLVLLCIGLLLLVLLIIYLCCKNKQQKVEESVKEESMAQDMFGDLAGATNVDDGMKDFADSRRVESSVDGDSLAISKQGDSPPMQNSIIIPFAAEKKIEANYVKDLNLKSPKTIVKKEVEETDSESTDTSTDFSGIDVDLLRRRGDIPQFNAKPNFLRF